MIPQVLHTIEDGVATVVLHHPAKRNAMTAQMWLALPPLLATLAADPQVRVLVLTGSGGTFCAGADISLLRGTDSDPAQVAEEQPAPAAGEQAGPRRLAMAAEEALADFPRPTLAAVRGHCVGGGCQLAVACDLRFADENALFGVSPAKLGVVYPPSATRRLVELVGPATAKYLLFSGELIDVGRALRTGLVDEVLPHGGLDARVAEFSRILMSRSQLTQTATKEFIAGRTDRADHFAAEARRSGETAEGAAAFLERRTPQFRWPEQR
ncbi:enoyl-CoA hydratase/isomerase family protein [Streptomyces odontomachi]|uniref:enoyl-CoA hydratase/isomerase family protein n=1 Tax=Streptomyces odontomachi TaxID=2944940 RepID=UPI00210B3A94|nr:enoyl-CoA hydratase/isomerase family protein [Streptomyces sp. ODS25]